jgi:hypothetical protein
MKAVWKYPLNLGGRQTIEIPFSAKLLSVVEQYDEPVAYFLVDPQESIMGDFRYEVWGTGHQHDDCDLTEMAYCATVVTNKGRLVWHVFVAEGWQP